MYFDYGYALIIGIANYPHINKLPEIVLNDAKDFYGILKGSGCGYPGNHLNLLLDEKADSDGIRKGLDWLIQAAGSKDTAVIYISSHGGRLQSQAYPENFLLPYDCIPSRISETSISANELTAKIGTIRARKLIIFFDFCYSGGTGEPKDPISDIPGFKQGYDSSYYESLAQGQGRVIMASSRFDEVSMILPGMKNSLFTHYLIEAFNGNAFSRGDGLIRVFDIFDYISDQVKTRYHQQHPIFKAADLEDNFPVSLFKNGNKTISHYQPDAAVIKGVNKTRLREFLLRFFNQDELKTLCFDIQEELAEAKIDLLVSLDIVGGESLPLRVQNLIDYLNRRGFLNYLLEGIRRNRPAVSTVFFEL